MLRTPMGLIAALAVCVLLGTAFWKTTSVARNDAQALSYTATSSAPIDEAALQQEMLLLGLATQIDPNANTESDPVALIGPLVVAQLAGSYAGLQDSGKISATSLTNSAESIAKNVRAAVTYKTYSVTDIKTDDDTSYEGMLRYRSDLRVAFAPLLLNTVNELELYAAFIESGDRIYLDYLSRASANYHEAIEKTAAVAAPKDAAIYHRDVLNALSAFAAILDSMVTHSTDVLAQAALLRSYNDAEQGVYDSFNALARYYGTKRP